MEIAILGFGGMGRQVLQTLTSDARISKVHVFDPDPKQCPKNSPSFAFTTELERILENPAIHLVFVTSPNHTHKDLALQCMRAGKAVMLEKPMAPTFGESELLVKESERLGVYLQVGFELRYSKLYTTVKDWIDLGLLGRVINTNCTYICCEFQGKNSWRNSLQGGGMFGEKLSHYVDLPRWWIGSEVSEVYSACAPNVVPYFEVHDNFHTTYKFADGAVSHLTFMMYMAETFEGDPLQNSVSQQLDDGHELRFLVVGTQGAVETDVFRRRIRRWTFGDSEKGLTSHLVETIRWKEEEDHHYFHDTTTQAKDVVYRVAQGLPPFTSPRDSLKTMRVVEAAEHSATTGRPVLLTAEEPLLAAIPDEVPPLSSLNFTT